MTAPQNKTGRTKPQLRSDEKIISTWMGRSMVGKRERSTAITITDQRVLISTIDGVGVKTWTQFPYINCIGSGGVTGHGDRCELSLSCDRQRVVLIGPRDKLQELFDAVFDAICDYTPFPD